MPASKLVFDADWVGPQPGSNPAEILKDAQKAYFKPIGSGHGVYPHAMLDFVGFLVGRVMGVPVADCRAVQLSDSTRGFASLWPPTPCAVWGKFPPGLGAVSSIDKFGGPKSFAELLVFDVWLGNMDRHAQNLVFRELDSGPWQLVLIDHGHIFANGGWANNWTDLESPVSAPNLAIPPFIRRDNIKLAEIFDILLAGEKKLLRSISTNVASIADHVLMDAVMQIPNDFATEEQLDATAQIVIRRKDGILRIFGE